MFSSAYSVKFKRSLTTARFLNDKFQYFYQADSNTVGGDASQEGVKNVVSVNSFDRVTHLS